MAGVGRGNTADCRTSPLQRHVQNRTHVEAGLSVSGSHNVNDRYVQLWTPMLDEMHHGRSCWGTSRKFGLDSGVASAAAMEGGRNFGTYLPARRGGSPANRLAVSSSEHDKQFFLCCRLAPESESRCPGWITSPRTKAFGPISAGSSAKDSTKSSYSLAASASAFCTTRRQDAAGDSSNDRKLQKLRLCLRCLVTRTRFFSSSCSLCFCNTWGKLSKLSCNFAAYFAFLPRPT